MEVSKVMGRALGCPPETVPAFRTIFTSIVHKTGPDQASLLSFDDPSVPRFEEDWQFYCAMRAQVTAEVITMSILRREEKQAWTQGLAGQDLFTLLVLSRTLTGQELMAHPLFRSKRFRCIVCLNPGLQSQLAEDPALARFVEEQGLQFTECGGVNAAIGLLLQSHQRVCVNLGAKSLGEYLRTEQNLIEMAVITEFESEHVVPSAGAFPLALLREHFRETWQSEKILSRSKEGLSGMGSIRFKVSLAKAKE